VLTPLCSQKELPVFECGREIPSIRALLLINTPSVTLTASYSRLKMRGKVRRARERKRMAIASQVFAWTPSRRRGTLPSLRSTLFVPGIPIHTHIHITPYPLLERQSNRVFLTPPSLSHFTVLGKTMAHSNICPSQACTADKSVDVTAHSHIMMYSCASD
jgi:hypothetical protein